MKSLLAAVSMEKVRLLSCIVHNATRSVCSCINNVEIVILSTINEPIDILALEAALPPARIITSPPKLLLMKNAPQALFFTYYDLNLVIYIVSSISDNILSLRRRMKDE